MTSLRVIRDAGEPKVPSLIAGPGSGLAPSFLEFFTVNIRNANTRAAYYLHFAWYNFVSSSEAARESCDECGRWHRGYVAR